MISNTKTYYQAEAHYESVSIYDVKSSETIKSPMLDNIEQVGEWIEKNRRREFVHGMGDIDYPQMDSCKVYQVEKAQVDFDLDAFFKDLDTPKVRHYNEKTHQFE